MRDPWEDAAIVRLCQRCRTYRSINDFTEGDHLCKGCMARPGYVSTGLFGMKARAVVLTDKGKAAIGKPTAA